MAVRLSPSWFPTSAFVRFCLVALVLGIPGAGFLYVLVEYAGIHYLLAGVINCLGMTLLSYYFNSVFTYGYFAGSGGFAKFVTSRIGSVVLGTLLYVLLTVAFGIWYLAASLLSAAIANVLNFAMSHAWVWAPRRRNQLRFGANQAGGEQ